MRPDEPLSGNHMSPRLMQRYLASAGGGGGSGKGHQRGSHMK